MTENEQALERRHLEQVEGVITKNLHSLYEEREQLKEQVLEARRDMWENSPRQIRDFDDVLQIADQGGQVSAAEKRFGENQREIARQEKMRNSPFFGRLDYREPGGERKVYIGIYGLRGEGSRRMLVVDWRAPVSSMFYSFDTGEAWFDAPNGRREVDITLKRQYKIQDGKLVLMYDTNSSMYDGILGQVLAQNTDHNLKVIVGSIQKEQNAAIRGDTRHSCLICGLAGSGKTSVGLHRLAYILYHDRDRVKAENILMVSNNGIFSSYISQILPELGEDPGESLVFHDLLDTVGREYELEDYYEQLKAVEYGQAKARRKWLRVKYAPDFLEYCTAYFANFPFKLPELRYGEEPILSPEAFQAKWGKMRFSAFRPGYELVKKMVREAIDDYFFAHREDICRDIERKSPVFLSEKETRSLYQKTRREYVEEAFAEIHRLNRLDPEAQAVEVLGNYLEALGEENDGAIELAKAFRRRKLWYEDGLLCLLIRLLMGEVPTRPEILHIVLDEAQDYSPLQLTILKLLYPKSSFTILADVFQAVGGLTATTDYSLFGRVFGPGLRETRLEKCYRSSSEINALAFQLLSREYPDMGKTYSYFQRHTQKPQWVVSSRPAQAVPPLLGRLGQYGSLGVITGDEDQAREVKACLGDQGQLIVSSGEKLTGRVAVLPLLLAKGLEFDGVILVSLAYSSKEDENFRRRLYLGCTRALHRLYLVEPEEPSEELEDCRPYWEIVREQGAQSPLL